MTPFSTLMTFAEQDGGYRTHIPDDWAQGRTAYGGLTAALCLNAVLQDHADLPPLRSAQITFIGPAGGDVELQTRLLRRGKNMTLIEADLTGEKGIATRSIFAFGTNRESHIDAPGLEMPEATIPEECPPLFAGGTGPIFTQHYDQRLARGGSPGTGQKSADNLIWVRYQDWQVNNDLVAMLALADATPPAIMSSFTQFGPISTVTWLVNFLNDRPQSTDGWWLLRANAEHTRDGYSSQDMTIWNRAGEPVIKAQQSIAIFV